MNRNSVYQVRLAKVICGGNRNINSYYVLLRNDKLPVKLISKAMRIDQDNQDELWGEIEIKPNSFEIWNYDKMRLVDRHKIDFKIQSKYTWTIYEENMEISIERFNEWQDEMRRRKEGEELLEPSSMRESGRTQQRSEATSSKIASNSPSKAVKTPSQKKSEPVSQLLLPPPPNPKRINDSIAKLTPQTQSEVKVEVISMVQY